MTFLAPLAGIRTRLFEALVAFLVQPIKHDRPLTAADPDKFAEVLRRGDVLLSVPPKPYAVLLYLVEHADRLITHDELMEALWPETYVQPQVLRTYVLELRRLLGDDAGDPRFIATVPKRGYRFLARVSDAPAKASSPARNGEAAAPPFDDGRAADDTLPTALRPEATGREKELARLQALMDRACRGERQVVFVTGDPGIGKTTLVDAFCDDSCAGARIARGQSVEGFGDKEPYYPVKELLNELCAAAKGEKTLRLLERIAPSCELAVHAAHHVHDVTVALD